MKEIEELRSNPELNGRIHFPGHLDDPFIFLRRASLLFLSSRDDAFPLAVLEAMGMARNVMAFDVGGAPEALDGKGILITPFDTDKAAKAVLDLLKVPKEERLNHDLRRRYLELYTPEKFALRLAGVIRRYSI